MTSPTYVSISVDKNDTQEFHSRITNSSLGTVTGSFYFDSVTSLMFFDIDSLRAMIEELRLLERDYANELNRPKIEEDYPDEAYIK